VVKVVEEEEAGKLVAPVKKRSREPNLRVSYVAKKENLVSDSTPFLIEGLVNYSVITDTFLDNGCLSTCALREGFVLKHNLKRIKIKPRRLKLAKDDSDTYQITEVAEFILDLEGRSQRLVGYVVDDLAYDVILGKPWMEQNDVVYHAKARRIVFQDTLQEIREKGWSEAAQYAQQREARFAIASLMSAWAKRAKGASYQVTKIFTTTMADINRALAPKTRLSRAQIEDRLPAELRQFWNLFLEEDGGQLPPHRQGLDHAIELQRDQQGNEVAAPWGPLYSMSREELLVLRKTLVQHMDKGWIRASNSPAGAPVLFVRKANGDLRFCCDYRAINALTRQDRYPLPLIKETLRSITEADWFTKVDVRAAFHRLRIRQGDEWKTAFRTRYGLFEWLVTPFGLAGAPASFQRFINHILRDLLGVTVTAYMDDILIYTKGSREEHLKVVKEVFRRLEKASLKLDLEKSQFMVKEVTCLGFIIRYKEGILIDPKKVEAVTKWEALTSVRDVRAFVGFANFYRDFIDGFSEIVMPLTALTKCEGLARSATTRGEPMLFITIWRKERRKERERRKPRSW